MHEESVGPSMADFPSYTASVPNYTSQ